VLEGPTRINIDSANSATVDSGSVVLHGYEAAPEFELITPQAKFLISVLSMEQKWQRTEALNYMFLKARFESSPLKES